MLVTKFSRAPGLSGSPWRKPGQIIAPWTTPQKRSSTQPAQRRCHRIAGTVGIAGRGKLRSATH